MEESLTQNLTESIKNVLGLKEISPAQLSPLVLAYIGDSIFDLVIKTYLLDTKGNMQVNKLNRFASNIVKEKPPLTAAGACDKAKRDAGRHPFPFL